MTYLSSADIFAVEREIFVVRSPNHSHLPSMHTLHEVGQLPCQAPWQIARCKPKTLDPRLLDVLDKGSGIECRFV